MKFPEPLFLFSKLPKHSENVRKRIWVIEKGNKLIEGQNGFVTQQHDREN